MGIRSGSVLHYVDHWSKFIFAYALEAKSTIGMLQMF